MSDQPVTPERERFTRILVDHANSKGYQLTFAESISTFWADIRVNSKSLQLSQWGCEIAYQYARSFDPPRMVTFVFEKRLIMTPTMLLQLRKLTGAYYPVMPGYLLERLMIFGEEDMIWLSLMGTSEIENYIRKLE